MMCCYTLYFKQISVILVVIYFIGGRKIYKCCGQFVLLNQEFTICHYACIYMYKDCSTTERLCLSVYSLYHHDPDNHDGVITHLGPAILDCEVKWASGGNTMNKASGGDGIPDEVFQLLKDNAVQVLHSKCQQIWKTQQWPQNWKRSVFIPIPKKGNAKECSNYRTIALISYTSKVMLKILQARL